MASPFKTFSSLFASTLLMVLGAGLLTTYLGLSLAARQTDQLWIGLMMSTYYLGLVIGSKIGHRLIANVGHIRAFVASAGVVTASALGHALTDQLEVWLVLRLIVGTGMMCQYMVLESWLNEQAESTQRGRVFASYMIVSYLGLVLGQLVLSQFPELGMAPLLLVGVCYALCIVPLATTKRLHPAPLHPAPLQISMFWHQVPQSLTSVAIAGLIVGSFYGLAPAFALSLGYSTTQVATFMSTTIVAGLLAQWPMGKISDVIPRSRLLRTNSALLGVLVLTMALVPLTEILLLVLTFMFGVLAFTLYPLATALANQHVESQHRVALSAVIILTFGIGACIGPLLASAAMQLLGNGMLYGFMAICCVVLFTRLQRVNYTQKMAKRLLQQQQSADYRMAAGDVVSSPLAVALDPRVDEELVQAQMTDEPATASDTKDADAASEADEPVTPEGPANAVTDTYADDPAYSENAQAVQTADTQVEPDTIEPVLSTHDRAEQGPTQGGEPARTDQTPAADESGQQTKSSSEQR